MKEKKYTLARTYYNLSRQVCVGCQQIWWILLLDNVCIFSHPTHMRRRSGFVDEYGSRSSSVFYCMESYMESYMYSHTLHTCADALGSWVDRVLDHLLCATAWNRICILTPYTHAQTLWVCGWIWF